MELRFYDFLSQVAMALAHMHALNICHRDLKPENLLYADGSPDASVLVADFGMAAYCGGGGNEASMTATGKGTLGYAAPEMLGTGSDGAGPVAYDKQVDMWALGVCLFALLGGYLPFDPQQRASKAEIEAAITRGRPAYGVSDGTGDGATDGAATDGDTTDGGYPEAWATVSPCARLCLDLLLQRDPTRRPTPSALLAGCAWVGKCGATATASGKRCVEARGKLKEFNASRRLWRAAANAVVAVTRGTLAATAAAKATNDGARAVVSVAVVADDTSFAGASGRLPTFLRSSTDDDLASAFRLLCDDGDGTHLRRAQVLELCDRFGIDGAEADAVLAGLDGDGDGRVSLDEFRAACFAPLAAISLDMADGGGDESAGGSGRCGATTPAAPNVDALRSAFGFFDTDGSGSIEMAELAALLERLGTHCSRGVVHFTDPSCPGVEQEAMLEAVFSVADANHDGEVTWAEFLAFLRTRRTSPAPSPLRKAPVATPAAERGKGAHRKGQLHRRQRRRRRRRLVIAVRPRCSRVKSYSPRGTRPRT
jgi:Ca2+-binding EF-hand superfamily protein